MRPLAGMLLVPYVAWVAFASELTFVVWRANPSLLG
ncbi:MAG TPA: tryptophan-rich sensory protein [Casimicrobiaceae bacterium]|nr:tryptophan-rich sensory protein [Casimicrobiaceae bacterium]